MPRKKPVAAAPAGPAPEDTEGQGINKFELPKSIVSRMAKESVPAGVKLKKEIPLALVQGSTVFINYLTALAHDIATEKKQKTITAAHVLEAIKQLGWEDSTELSKGLKKELAAYRKAVEAKKAGAPAPNPRVPGRPVGRPPKASTSAAATAVSAPRVVNSPAAAEPVGQENEGDEDANMTVLRDDGDAPEEEGEEQAYGTGDEEAEDMFEGEEEEDEEDEEDEEAEAEADEPVGEVVEDRVGAGLEEDVGMDGGSGAED